VFEITIPTPDNKFKVPDAEQKDLLGIIGTLKNDIVENKQRRGKL